MSVTSIRLCTRWNDGIEFTNKHLAAALREYLCSTFLEEDKQRMIAKQLDTD